MRSTVFDRRTIAIYVRVEESPDKFGLVGANRS